MLGRNTLLTGERRKGQASPAIHAPGKRKAVRGSCTAFVAYDHKTPRDLAMVVCDQLVHRFAGDIDFQITWWKLDFLLDPHIAHNAIREAMSSDIFIFAASRLDMELREVIESWLSRRRQEDGLLVYLEPSRRMAIPEYEATRCFIRNAAHRAHLDFLTIDVPETVLPHPVPSTSVIAAAKDGSLVERLRDLEATPARWGINE